MPREIDPPTMFERTAAPVPGLSPQSVQVVCHTTGALQIGVRSGNSALAVLMDRESGRALRDWLCKMDLDAPTHEQRITALRDLVEEYEREYGPLDRAMLDEVHATWPDVAYGGQECCPDHEAHRRARRPRSLGMGQDGPADLSQREGFE
jgi:hypothetical protein